LESFVPAAQPLVGHIGDALRQAADLATNNSLTQAGSVLASHICNISLGPGEVFAFDGVTDFETLPTGENVCALRSVDLPDALVSQDLSDCNNANSTLYDPAVVKAVEPVVASGYTRCGVRFKDGIGPNSRSALLQYQEKLRKAGVERSDAYKALLGETEVVQGKVDTKAKVVGTGKAEARAFSQQEAYLRRQRSLLEMRRDRDTSQLAAANADLTNVTRQLADATAMSGSIANSIARPTAAAAEFTTRKARVDQELIQYASEAERLTMDIGAVNVSIAAMEQQDTDAKRSIVSYGAQLDKVLADERLVAPRNCPSARDEYVRMYGSVMQAGDPWEDFRTRSSWDLRVQWPACNPLWEPLHVHVPEPPERPSIALPGPEYIGCWDNASAFGQDAVAFAGEAGANFHAAIRQAHERQHSYVAISRSGTHGTGFTFNGEPTGRQSESRQCTTMCADSLQYCGCSERFNNCSGKQWAVYKVYGKGKPYDYNAPVQPNVPLSAMAVVAGMHGQSHQTSGTAGRR
jgi:hypothetical protein